MRTLATPDPPASSHYSLPHITVSRDRCPPFSSLLGPRSSHCLSQPPLHPATPCFALRDHGRAAPLEQPRLFPPPRPPHRPAPLAPDRNHPLQLHLPARHSTVDATTSCVRAPMTNTIARGRQTFASLFRIPPLLRGSAPAALPVPVAKPPVIADARGTGSKSALCPSAETGAARRPRQNIFSRYRHPRIMPSCIAASVR